MRGPPTAADAFAKATQKLATAAAAKRHQSSTFHSSALARSLISGASHRSTNGHFSQPSVQLERDRRDDTVIKCKQNREGSHGTSEPISHRMAALQTWAGDPIDHGNKPRLNAQDFPLICKSKKQVEAPSERRGGSGINGECASAGGGAAAHLESSQVLRNPRRTKRVSSHTHPKLLLPLPSLYREIFS